MRSRFSKPRQNSHVPEPEKDLKLIWELAEALVAQGGSEHGYSPQQSCNEG